MILRSWAKLSQELIIKSINCCGQGRNSLVDEITCLKDGNKARDAYILVKEFWNNPESVVITESEDKCIKPSDNHFEENELFLLDSDDE